ncbi:cob(I)yrinic acid a,c-diamide adenosyltransferase [Actinotalea sp. M2MS4P-6]|uniref:cob(I)yrinic acid a,c-diamide adenosyltransferase n=1 Tax=Actinotalea sp. M2MS4P-6 TaxID=2983762 RepID=UPI0021E37F31|nr:cob(I)yrinic acid a,c-diamide adenosyltransferase [Actinotalea sp. M2MS4P-6]MCV2394638.1 cob(I)yrinic acid a,c-diamide adenosyltransferase [Actinotalea sp. M2MS4P-6]
MRVYTKTGDDGTTGRFLGGRVPKSDVLIEASGDVDEAIAVLGVVRAGCEDEALAETVLTLQRELFVVGADLATNPDHRDRLRPGVSLVTEQMVEALEDRIDRLVAEQPLRPVFVVPGSDLTSSRLDHARTVVRRSERHVVAAEEAGHVVSPAVLRYLNRLSDLLFVLARNAAGDVEPPSHD